MSLSPIFLHSLFRAGSTYLFSVFRRSPEGYWCYQEPLHERAVLARDEPAKLLEGFSKAQARLFRHPALSTHYFQELFEVWPAWKSALHSEAVYDDYFAPAGAELGVRYWQALIQAARGRPVFQECRTSGRIRAIRDALGGYHIYLWRNPWDQWWSYRVAAYFDAASLLVVNAPGAPEPIQLLRQELGLSSVRQDPGLTEAFAEAFSRPLTVEQSFLVFYTLWCLGLRQGSQHADLLINIDHLSDDSDYRNQLQRTLASQGVEGLDFSDCKIPQGHYSQTEQSEFRRLEDRVHGWLRAGDWSEAELDALHQYRKDFAPRHWLRQGRDIDAQSIMADAPRAREVALRIQDDAALRFASELAHRQQAETEATSQRTRAERSESWAAEQHQRADAAERALRQIRRDLERAHEHAVQLQAKIEVLEQQMRDATQRVGDAANAAVEQRQRAEAAEASAREERQRAEAAEASAREQQQKAAAVEAVVNEQQQRLAAAEAMLSELEHLRTMAQHLQAERDALRASWSWRITLPLRATLGLPGHIAGGVTRLSGLLGRDVLEASRRVVVVVIAPILRRPALSRALGQLLSHVPWLQRRVQAFLVTGSRIAAPGPGRIGHGFNPNADDIVLTAKAQSVYRKLRESIEQQKAGH